MEWSRFFQSSRNLEMSRKYYLFSQDLKPLVWKYLELGPGLTALDVGCGSGFFTRVLAEGISEGRIYGLDVDYEHIQTAREIIQNQKPPVLAHITEFVVGDALALPYENGSMDLVTSHTFFNVVKEFRQSLAEMIRVTRNGGRVATIDSMSLGNQTWHLGYYPDESGFLTRLARLEKKVWRMFQAIYPLNGVAAGIPTSRIPHFFSQMGLKNVRVYGLGRVFSLSNAAMLLEEKEEYINFVYEDAVEKVNNYWELPAARQYLSQDDLTEYLDLLLQKRDYLLARIGENQIWDWHGGANLLTIGDVYR